MTNFVGEQFGNYRLLRLLGEGGFAEVYLGEHIHLKTYAAIKVLSTKLPQADTEEFRREAQTIARLDHLHIVRVLDFGIKDRLPFLVLSYAPHGTLRSKHPKGTSLPLAAVVDYVNQVGEALQYAHDAHIVHRDIKPENMLIGPRQEVLLSDFGIALVMQTSDLKNMQNMQNMQNIAGTIIYMAPEQISGHPCLASDQYALAIVAYEWLSGKPPFQGSFTEIAAQHHLKPPPSLREKDSQIPLEVEEVIVTALSKDPNARFSSVREFAQALEKSSLSPTLSSFSLSQKPDPGRSSSTTNASLTQTQPVTAMHTPLTQAQPVATVLTRRSRIKRSVVIARLITFVVLLFGLLTIISLQRYQENAYRVGTSSPAIAPEDPKKTLAAITALASQAKFPAQPGNLLFATPLLHNDAGEAWTEDPGNAYGGACRFENDGYHVIEQQNYVNTCYLQSAQLHNFAFEVSMQVVKGSCGGFNFRDDKFSHAYHFQICQDGSYALIRYDSNTNTTVFSGQSSYLHTGLFQANQIEAIGLESTLIFYINRQKIKSITETSYSDGFIGLRASSYGQSVEVVYTNAHLWSL